MRKVIAALNMTINGNCDHEAGIPDEEVHQHYTELLGKADQILYGRTTFQLMEYWRTLLDHPSDDKSMNDFAHAINKIPKIVFSHSIKKVEWETANLSVKTLEEEISGLRQQPGKNILIGSRSLIIQLMNLNLIDEYQLCIHPVVEGGGLPLFDEQSERAIFKLTKTKTFGNGAIILYYEPASKITMGN